ncbi:putative baseplate assembly protein [Jidongwangia harbinensis]|uniref:putative baseplate assembly protein n=1 Tax=Jidongwangia harbinensis TaxID=2878561 RepID=UPI001CD95602|nr:putative baseplate assembly protein [Jidongwangia harbinensis]MCA2218023.1 putative baseplate assembly protein [Jidongwangia harbinensis]
MNCACDTCRTTGGTHGAVLAAMLGQLSGRLPALTVRDAGDPSIAMLDAWATISHILSFYQERIDDEGYLETATERRSVLELARLVDYRLRPGVAAGVHLAFTLDPDPAGDTTVPIPAGTRAQSLPGPGEQPQVFETSREIPARSAWNLIRPRLTVQPRIDADEVPALERIYLAGITTGLRPNDRLLFDAGDAAQVGRVAATVEDAAADRTAVTLQPTLTAEQLRLLRTVRDRLAVHRDLSRLGLAGVRRAERVDEELLAPLAEAASGPGGAAQLPQLLPVALQRLGERLTEVRARGFTRLTRWLGTLITDLTAVDTTPPALAKAAPAGLDSLLGSLAKPPSRPPAGPQDLRHSLPALFGAGSSLTPQVLAALRPELAATLPAAVASAGEAVVSRIRAARVRAVPFGATAAPRAVPNQPGVFEEWPLDGAEGVRISAAVSYRTSAAPLDVPTTADLELTIGTEVMTANGVVLDGSTKTVPIGPDQSVEVTDTRVAAEGSRLRLRFVGRVNRTVEIDGPALIALNLLAADAPFVIRLGAQREFQPISGLPQEDVQRLTDGRVTARFDRAPAAPEVGTVRLTEESLTGPPDPLLLPLDAVYEQIPPDTTVIIERPGLPGPILAEVEEVDTVSMSAYNLNATVTRLRLSKPWRADTDVSLVVARETTVYAAPEALDLARQPDPDPVGGDDLPLDQAYDGLSTGRLLIVRGERADLPGITGVIAAEVVMIAGVTQGADPDRPGDTVHTTLQLAEPLAHEYHRNTVEIFGNVAEATHGESVAELLGSGDASVPFQSFPLRRKPVAFLPSSETIGATSTLRVEVNGIRWHEADNLTFLGPADRRFTTRVDPDETTTVVFGDGAHGARPPTGVENIAARYRAGGGSAGLVPAGRITQLLTRPLRVSGVTNPLESTGGADRDTLEMARENAPTGVHALDRLVSVSDYADFTRARAGIGKAAAVRLSDGFRPVVHVTVAGVGDARPTSLLPSLRAALARFGDPAQPVRVAERELLMLLLAINVEVHPDHRWELVERAVRAALLDRFGFARRALGQDVVLSDVISTVHRVSGVVYADVDSIGVVPEDVTSAALEALTAGLTTPPPPRIAVDMARFDDDTGKLRPAQIAILSPEVPETLVLQEVTP